MRTHKSIVKAHCCRRGILGHQSGW